MTPLERALARLGVSFGLVVYSSTNGQRACVRVASAYGVTRANRAAVRVIWEEARDGVYGGGEVVVMQTAALEHGLAREPVHYGVWEDWRAANANALRDWISARPSIDEEDEHV